MQPKNLSNLSNSMIYFEPLSRALSPPLVVGPSTPLEMLALTLASMFKFKILPPIFALKWLQRRLAHSLNVQYWPPYCWPAR